MKASQNPPGVRREAVRHDGGPTSGSRAGDDNLVIENLAEFAAEGVSGFCQLCWADYAAPPAAA
jgi:hypothetical protein